MTRLRILGARFHVATVADLAVLLGFDVLPLPGLPPHTGELGGRRYVATDPRLPLWTRRRAMVSALVAAVHRRPVDNQRMRRACRRLLAMVRQSSTSEPSSAGSPTVDPGRLLAGLRQ